MGTTREVDTIVTARRQLEGGGFVVRRPFPSPQFSYIDPFLLLDEMGPAEYGPLEAMGAPDHPHRGFETVTYMLEGEFEHEDSAGHRGVIRAGDVQWMTAGAGVVHSEMPAEHIRRDGGRVHGFQLWLNLPARDKMMPPRYQEVPSASIPKVTTPDGLASAVVLAGEALSVRAVIDTRTPILYQDWSLKPGADIKLPVPSSFNMMAFVFRPNAQLGRSETNSHRDQIGGKKARLARMGGSTAGSTQPISGVRGTVHLGNDAAPVHDGQLAVFRDGDIVRMALPPSESVDARVLLLGGEPIGEPVARYGPFVMNSPAEIRDAIEDFRAGRMGAIVRGNP